MKTLNFKNNFTILHFAFKTLAIIAFIAIFSSCSKDGPAGAAGNDGQDGNANVQQYTFGSRTFSNTNDYEIPNLTQTQLDNSVILCYYQDAGNPNYTYPCPGIGSANLYLTRNYFEIFGTGVTCTVSLRTLVGDFYNTNVTFSKFRIIVIPSSSNIPLARASSKNDYSKMTYHEVCQQFNLKE